jgi:hypothetical protein
MEQAKEYRAYATTAVGLATRSDDNNNKIILLKIAQGWLDLAERAETADKKVKICAGLREVPPAFTCGQGEEQIGRVMSGPKQAKQFCHRDSFRLDHSARIQR